MSHDYDQLLGAGGFRVKRRMKNENSYLIEKLRAFKDMRTVILMCYWE